MKENVKEKDKNIINKAKDKAEKGYEKSKDKIYEKTSNLSSDIKNKAE